MYSTLSIEYMDLYFIELAVLAEKTDITVNFFYLTKGLFFNLTFITWKIGSNSS